MSHVGKHVGSHVGSHVGNHVGGHVGGFGRGWVPPAYFFGVRASEMLPRCEGNVVLAF